MSLPEVTTVERPEAAPLGFDPEPLFDLGLREVRAYASALWTDHNTHDPGITTLELLCYALTDLCYRACFPIEDLLAAHGDNVANMRAQFFRARELLPNRPLTEIDYRKLLIDVEGVRNAWILPFTFTCYADLVHGQLLEDDPGRPGVRPVQLRGLYRALIEFADDGLAPADRARVTAAARAALLANRNLCEDFVDVVPVQRQSFLLCGDVEIEPQADPAGTYARILLAVQQYLAPGVARYSRAERLQRPLADGTPRTDPDIFEGPALAHGFIDETELAAADLRTSIRLSDVIALIMDIDGVRAVRDAIIRPADPDDAAATQNESKWEVSVRPGERCVLDTDHSRLILYKGNNPLPRPGDALARYAALKDAAETANGPKPLDDPQIPLGTPRDAGVYESVQKHFPDVYGIGDAALPGGATLDRVAQARQLEGYLLFFDQLLANAFAQLGEVRQLYSRDASVAQTYFGQRVAGLDELYKAGADDIALETQAQMLERRNRFLDHLVARFAERLHDDLQIQAALLGTTPAAAARAKCAFLGDYPDLGGGRARACDYTQDPASGAAARNVSGLEKRLAHLLGLGAITYEIYQERDTDSADEYRFRVRERTTDGVLLSSSTKYSSVDLALAELAQAVAAAEQPSGYQRRQTPKGEYYFNIIDGSGNVIARRIEYFRGADARDAAIDALIAVMVEHHGERMCVIEDILLRPRADTEGSFLSICADPGCGEDCPGDDPYSYRLHVVLPALAPRFRDNMEFRRFAEDVIRQETPAHLAPKVCWVGDQDMSDIETAWLAWQSLLAEVDTSNPTGKFAALRSALEKARNVYPAPTLADCASADKFILGQSALGSEPPAPA